MKKRSLLIVGFLSLISFIINTTLIAAETPPASLPSVVFAEEQTWLHKVQEGLQERFSKKTTHTRPENKELFLIAFYQKRDFKPLWLNENGWHSAANAVIETLSQAFKEGLDPDAYKDDIQIFLKVSGNDPKTLLEAEIALTRAVLNYIHDLFGGRLNPKKIDKRLALTPESIDVSAVLAKGVEDDPSFEWLKVLTVRLPEYQDLKKLLADYINLSSQSRPLLMPGKSLKKGDVDPRINILRALLRQENDLKNANDSNAFDEELENALQHFQQRHGLEADGILGNLTLETLNIPISEKIKKIIVSMERWRWMPKILGKRYVLVNIAGTELQAFEDDKPVLEMPIIVGLKYLQTPVFSSVIYGIRFNPSWHVPHSIAIKDELKNFSKDPSYARKKGFIVKDSDGSFVDPESIDWSAVTPDSFSYTFVQRPGAQNALGKIRFSIQSPFDVYLHSTPNASLFNKAVRFLSHGCIRVAKPLELANFIFNDPDWPLEKINAAMEGDITSNITLKNPVSVYINYFTAWTDNEEVPHFVTDVYGQDEKIWNALADLKQKI
jgi:murein L,D-transpeptidase YcbB/YkuD